MIASDEFKEGMASMLMRKFAAAHGVTDDPFSPPEDGSGLGVPGPVTVPKGTDPMFVDLLKEKGA